MHSAAGGQAGTRATATDLQPPAPPLQLLSNHLPRRQPSLVPAQSRRPFTGAVEEPKFISVVGEGTCGVYAIEAGNTLRAVPTALSKRDTQPFTCHAWLLDGGAAGAGGADLRALVVGTRRGEALVLVDGEVRQVLTLEGGARVEAVAAHSKVRREVGSGRVAQHRALRRDDPVPMRL